MSRVGIVTGLKSEACCLAGVLRGGQAAVRVAGADGGRASAAARALLEDGCEGLVSFGMAGGLAPGLAPGRLVLAGRILGEHAEHLPVNTAWRDRLLASLSQVTEVAQGDLAGSGSLVDSPQAKAALHRATGALVVDMESLAVARVAASAALPFVAVRAVADPAGRAPPPWAAALVRPDGGVDGMAVARTLLRRPSVLPAMLEMGRDSRAALATLRRVALCAGPLLGLR